VRPVHTIYRQRVDVRVEQQSRIETLYKGNSVTASGVQEIQDEHSRDGAKHPDGVR